MKRIKAGNKSIAAGLAAATMLLCGWSAALAQGLAPSEHLQFADGLYARGMHKAALTEYTAYLAAHPDGPSLDVANFRLGECARELGDNETALKAYKRVFPAFPKSEFYHRAGYRRAELFFDLGQFEAAAELFAELLAAKPNDDMSGAAHYLRGTALTKIGRGNESAEDFAAVVQGQPGSRFYTYALLALGEVRRQQNKLDEAAGLYRKVTQMTAPARVAAEAWFQLADLLSRQKQYAESAKAFEALLAKYPDDKRTEEARLPAAWAQHNCGRYAEALAAIPAPEAFRADTNRAPEWLYLMANCQRQLVKSQEAADTYGRLLAQYPAHRLAEAARYEKAVVHYRQTQYAQVVELLRAGSWSETRVRDVTWLLAESYAALHKDDEAVENYRLMAEKFPADPLAADALYRLASLLQKRGQFPEAAVQYRSLVEKFPASPLVPQALLAAGFCFAKNGNREKAVQAWTELLTAHADAPEAEEALYQKAMSEVLLKRDEAARASLGDLIRQYPKSAKLSQAQYWLGVLLNDAGNAQDAAAALRKAIALGEEGEARRKAQFTLGHVVYKLQQYDEALALLQPLLSSDQKEKFSLEMLEWMATYRMDKKQYAEAGEAAARIVAAGSDPAWLQLGWCLSGRSRLAQNQSAAAAEAFAKALATGAQTRYAPESALRLGELTLAAGKAAEAIPHFEKAAEWAASPEMLGIRARAYAGLGQASQALDQQEKATRYFLIVALLFDDKDVVPDCLCRAAESFDRLSRKEEARKAIAELRERFPEAPCLKDVEKRLSLEVPAPAVAPASAAGAGTPAPLPPGGAN